MSTEASGVSSQAGAEALFEDRIYVLTPNAAIVELPKVPPPSILRTPYTPTWVTDAAVPKPMA